MNGCILLFHGIHELHTLLRPALSASLRTDVSQYQRHSIQVVGLDHDRLMMMHTQLGGAAMNLSCYLDGTLSSLLDFCSGYVCTCPAGQSVGRVYTAPMAQKHGGHWSLTAASAPEPLDGQTKE